MNKNKMILNNNGIAILLVCNILISIIALINSSKPSEIVHATNNEVENTEVADNKRKENTTDSNEEDFEVEATWNINDVENNADIENTMELYFQYTNEEGAWFTARETTSTDEIQADWFVDYKTLSKANIDTNFLVHNDTIKAVFVTNGNHDYFEIVTVAQ